MPFVEVKNITYQYGKGTPFAQTAVQNVSFSFEKNEVISVIGHTGSGKSTLMQMLNALLRPDSGDIFLQGVNINKDKKQVYQTRFRIGLCFQYPEYQLFGESCWEDIAFGPTNMGLEQDEISRRVETAAKLVRLSYDDLKKSPFDLSGGQKRRCAIAGVLAMQPEVLVLDEPTAGLDPEGRRAILSVVRDYHEKTGAAVILVTHSMEIAAAFSNRILVLDHGRLIMDGTPEDVFSHSAELEAADLQIPFPLRVTRAIKDAGFEIQEAYTAEAAVKSICTLLRAEGKR